MAEALKNSQDFWWMHDSSYPLWGRERRSLAGRIAVALMWPEILIKAGRVDADDIKNFPGHLKRLLRVFGWIGLIGIVWALVSYLILKLR